MRAAAALLLIVFGSAVLADAPPFRVIDRRAVDGSVIVVRNVVRQSTGGKPFLSARHWDLTPASDFFRVKELRIPARHVGTASDPPAITLRDGKVGPNNWTNALGGSPTTFFEPGEIVRLVRLNAAFKIVRMDVESVCRRESRGRHLRGRVDVVLSGQVNAATFDEANRGVAQVLEPVELARVLEVCDPDTGQPPLRISVGTPMKVLEERLGEPRSVDGQVVDYGPIVVEVRSGVVSRIRVPSID